MQSFEPVAWQDHTPRSARFKDIYRNRYDALRQSTEVFLTGCELPQRWHHRSRFTVLETGFGLGLNFLTTWASWLNDPHACNTLQFVSIEAYPVAAHDLLQSAQSLLPHIDQRDALSEQVLKLAHQLADVWMNLKPGLNSWTFTSGQNQQVQLDLLVGDVLPMLRAWSHHTDAVYLDGFSPSRNPDMWSTDTLTEVARLCVPGARLATYTVAAAVRHQLTSLGFSVRKYPGVPPKRDRLQASMSNTPK